MNHHSGISEHAIHGALIGLAKHQLELGEDATAYQLSTIRGTVQFYVPTQDPRSLLMNWDTVVSQTRIRNEIEADPVHAVHTYTGQEFARPGDWTDLDNDAIRDREYALDRLMNPRPLVLVLGVPA